MPQETQKKQKRKQTPNCPHAETSPRGISTPLSRKDQGKKETRKIADRGICLGKKQTETPTPTNEIIVNFVALIHAVLVGTLRGHGRSRHARRYRDIVHIADKSLRVEPEGFAHKPGDSTFVSA